MPANEDQLDRQFGFDLSSDAWMGRVRAALSEGVAPESSLSEHQPGDQIGNYELLDIVGKGGMGTVWKARRTDKRADRVVALKLIRSGMDSQTALRRFRLEEQVLARLEHPHIARLYDGGNSAGQPFFVMELVEGIPLNEFVRQRGLSVDERLTLYQNVCDAVHYAHSELVLHRDLKPGNILVTQDGDPKLLDFGIARILEHDHAVSAGITATDTRVLTPAYASPEQVRGERLSTSTDIYSLGVVLFELLTGVLPYEADRTSRHQLERAILEQEPIRPSTMVAQDTGLPQRVRKRLSRELRGDLDAICMKATARSPDQRYRSAQEMGEDVRRYLHGAPLLAKPPSTLAVMGRLIKRRRGVIGATTVGTALGLFAAALFVVSQFMVPRWQEEYITEARAAIVGAESNNNIGLYNVLYFSQLNPYDSPYDELQPSLQLALEAYEAARQLGDVEADVAGELASFRLAAALITRKATIEEELGELPDECRLTRSYATYIKKELAFPEPDENQMADASPTDLRCLGLIAFQLRDYLTQVESWTRLPLTKPDPVVECLLGYVHLALDEGELAYPRMLSAFRAYPESGNLAAYLADAAARCGDIDQAAYYVELANSLPMTDPTGPVARVEVLIELKKNNLQGAWARLCDPYLDLGPVMTTQIAQHLARNKGLEPAITVMSKEIYNHKNRRAAYEYFAKLLEAWWIQLPPDVQKAISRGQLDSIPWPESYFRDFLFRYRIAVRRLQELVNAGDLLPHPLFARNQWTTLDMTYDESEHEAARQAILVIDVEPVERSQEKFCFCDEDWSP